MSTHDDVRIRPARADEADTLWVLRTRCVRETCSSHYPPEVITAWSASPPPSHYRALLDSGGGLIAEDATGQLLGYGVFDRAGNEIDALFVNPDCAGRGIGLRLMGAMEAMADPARALMLSASLNAVPFYQRCGFDALNEEAYAHPSGIALASVRMRKTRAG